MTDIHDRLTHLIEGFEAVDTLPKLHGFYYPVKNEDSPGWNYVCTNLTVDDIRAARDEIVRLRERLDAGPFGEDTVDVWESSADYLRDEIARLRAELRRK